MPRLSRGPAWLFGLLALAACASAPPEAPAPPRPRVLLGDAEVHAIAEILRLEDRREFDAVRLSALLGDAYPEVRRRAALAAGRIGDRRATPLLLQALGDPTPEVRADAAFALGELGDTTTRVVRALYDLASATGGEPEAIAVAVEAAAALGKIGSPAARQALEQGPLLPRDCLDRSATPVDCRGQPPAVLGEALLAIWKFPRQEHTASLVLPHVRARDPELRWRAAYALMRLGDPATSTVLRDLLRDADHRVRAFAARGLRAPVTDSAGARATAAAALTAALDDPHPHVQISALRALGTYRDSALVRAVIARLGDPDPNVAITAAEAAGDLGGEEAAAALAAVVTNDQARLPLRGAALASLARLAPAQSAKFAATLAGAESWLERLYAARSLRGAPRTVAEPLLLRLARDPDPRVAAGAVEGLATFGGDTIPRIYAILIEALASLDVGVRTAALHGLARRAQAADLPLLLQAYERAQLDSGSNDATLAAVAALGALAERGIPVARSFFLRFPRSPDPLVRLAVERRIGRGSWGEPLPIETERGLAFYADIVRRLVAPELAGEGRHRVRIRTAAGAITLDLAGAEAPLTVHNFLTLADRGFFDRTRWHRVVPNFVLQAGDPRGDGSGGPGYAIPDELNRIRYTRGIVGMALSGPDTGGSQFFITHSPQPHLDGGYTAFGRVVAGMDAADRVVQDDPVEAIEICHDPIPAGSPSPRAADRCPGGGPDGAVRKEQDPV